MCISEEKEVLNKKTAHQVSHERTELRRQSRLPVWQQQVPVTSSRDENTPPFIIAEGSLQRIDQVRRCTSGSVIFTHHI